MPATAFVVAKLLLRCSTNALGPVFKLVRVRSAQQATRLSSPSASVGAPPSNLTAHFYASGPFGILPQRVPLAVCRQPKRLSIRLRSWGREGVHRDDLDSEAASEPLRAQNAVVTAHGFLHDVVVDVVRRRRRRLRFTTACTWTARGCSCTLTPLL